MSHLSRSICRALPKVLVDFFAWMLRYGGKNRNKYPIETRYKALRKTVIRIVNKFDIEVIVEGKENIPNEVSAYFPNHMSGYDPLVILSALDKPSSFLAKKEVSNIIGVKQCINAIDGLYIDREDLKQSLRVMMEIQKDLKMKKKNWIIFPEGTRRKDPMRTIKEFHHGTFRSAMKAGVPIVPVALYGTSTVLKNHPRYKKYPVIIKFLKPLYPSQYNNMSTQEVAKYVQDEVDKAISFDLRNKEHKLLLNEKEYRFNKISY